MKRDNVVDCCMTAVKACWNHYSDLSLNDEDILRVSDALNDLLPQSVDTTQHDAYAKGYNEYVRSQET